VTAPVVVDPAPPDLATGLDTLARAAGAARADARPLLLVAADLQVHTEALADLAEDPRPATAALVSRSGARPGLRIRAGRVVAAATPAHRVADPDTSFAGALRVAVADLDAAEGAADELATAARQDGWAGDPLGYLLLGLVRTGVRVGTVSLDPWRWGRDPADPARSLQAELDAIRATGIGRVCEEYEVGLNAAAAPVRDRFGSVVAAVSVSGPSYRLTPERMDEIAPGLVAGAVEISRRMGYVGRGAT